MGHRLLHQSNTSGRIGAVLARSKDSHGRGEKVGVYANTVAGGCPKSSSKFAILRDSARYPSGPRERSAKPPFVGSNPTRASKPVVYAVSANRQVRFGAKGGLADLPHSSNLSFWLNF